MIQLGYLGVWSAAGLDDQPAITDIVWGGGAGDAIFTSSGAFGTLSHWEFQNGGLVLLGQVDLLGQQATSSSGEIDVVTLGGTAFVAVSGGAADGIDVFDPNGGGFGGTTTIAADIGDVSSTLWIADGSGAILVTDGVLAGTLAAWSVSAEGQLSEIDSAFVGGTDGYVGTTGLTHFQQNEQDYVVSLDVGGNAVTLLEVSDTGLERVDRVDAQDGLAVYLPTHVEVVDFRGETFVIVTAAGSNSISVLAVNDGVMTLRDHVLDDLNTRFDGVGVLTTVEFNGRVFIAVSGQDSGLTVFTMVPGGQLLTVATREDQIGAPLEDITAMEFVEGEGGLQLVVAGEGWVGLSILDVDTGVLSDVQRGSNGANSITGGAENDMIDGRGGNDVLSGGAGDDVLIDGFGTDALFGGVGADTFVFSLDRALDRIEDFELGVDEINLSFLGRAYSLDALEFSALSGGIRITFNDEVLEVFSHDGSDISEADLTYQMLFDLTHSALAPLPVENQVLTRDYGSEYLQGGSGNDTLLGGLMNEDFDVAAGQITRLFQATLGREPAQTGHMLWVDRLLDGDLTGEEAASLFVASAEFQLRFGDTTNLEFVTLLFENVLGRAPAESGLTAWTNNLDNGMSRESVTWLFSESDEFQNNMATVTLQYTSAVYQASFTDDVYRLFIATLGREPKEDGLLAWSENLVNGTDYLEVISLFVSGLEFQITYGDATDEEFVTLLYENVLGRMPAQEGFDGWVANLQNGMSREQVVENFAQSAEFIITSNDDLTNFMRELGPDLVLEGGTGNDVLVGGALSDVFIFDNLTSGDDMIVDFEAWDVVELVGGNYQSAQQVVGDLQQVGNNVVLALESGSITYLDTAVDEFDALNFWI